MELTKLYIQAVVSLGSGLIGLINFGQTIKKIKDYGKQGE